MSTLSSFTFLPKLLGAYLLIVGTASAVLYLHRFQAEEELLAQAEANLEEVVAVVHYATRNLQKGENVDRKWLQDFIKKAKDMQMVEHVTLADNFGRIVASSRPHLEGQVIDDLGPNPTLQVLVDTVVRTDPYRMSIPLLDDGQVLGWVEAVFQLHDLRFGLGKVYQQRFFVFAGAMLLGLLVFAWVADSLHRPYRLLGEGAEQVAAGNFSIRLPEKESGREKSMASAFNSMVDKLSRQRELEEKWHEMEKRGLLAELSASVAHEVRNPLNLMNLSLHQLAKKAQAESPDRDQILGFIEGLRAEVRHLNQVVTHYLELGRPKAMEMTRFPLLELWNEVEILLRRKLNEQEAKVVIRIPKVLEVSADRESLRLVLLNLSLNALEASGPSGRILIKATQGDDDVAIDFEDNGPGIPPEMHQRIFEPYCSGKPRGMGLGLALVKRLIEDHGGRIHVYTPATGGAGFAIRLPGKDSESD